MNDNPAAFPCGTDTGRDRGMTLRDYFAAQALLWVPNLVGGIKRVPSEVAEDAYMIADAMLTERALLRDRNGKFSKV